MPTNQTLLLPNSPLDSLTCLQKGKYPLEEEFLHFFRRLIDGDKHTRLTRKLPVEENLINCAKKFLKDPRELIREVGFELLLTIEENSSQNTLTPQIVYELSKRNHSYARVTKLLNTDFIPNSNHSPLEWIENLSQAKDKSLMRVACQIWSKLSNEHKFSSGASLCRSIIGLDNELALLIFGKLIKSKHFDSKMISSLLSLIVKTFSDNELTAILPTLSRVSKKIPSEHQNEHYIESLLSIQKRFGSSFVEPVANFEMEWEYYSKVTVVSEENLSTLYRLINNPRFLEVCKDPNTAYFSFLKMARELGVCSHRAITTKALTFLMQNRGSATQTYKTLRDLWHPSFPLPKRAKKVLVKTAPLLIKDLKAQNKPETLCRLSLLLEFYGIKPTAFTDDLIWAVSRILPHPDEKAILAQICKNVTTQKQAVLEIAFQVKDAKNAVKLLKQIPVNEENIARSMGRLAALDFDIAANYLFSLKISKDSLQACANEMIAFSGNGSCLLAALFHLHFGSEKPQNFDTLLDELIQVGSSDSLSAVMQLLTTHTVSDIPIWVKLLTKLIPMAKGDNSLLISSAFLLAQLIDKKPNTQLKEILDLGIYTLNQLDQYDKSQVLDPIYQLSTIMIKNLPDCPSSVHVALVKATLTYAANNSATRGIQVAIEVFLEQHPKLNGECEDEVIDCLLSLTKSTEGIILFGDYLPRIIMVLGGHGSQLFFQPILKPQTCEIKLNEYNRIHPDFKKFRPLYFSFMSKIINKALHVHSETLIDQDVFLYDFIERNLRNLITHAREPSPKTSELVRLLMYYIKPGSRFFEDHIIHVKSMLNDALQHNILDDTSEILAECVIYLERKVTLSKSLPPHKQKDIFNRVIDQLLSEHTVEGVIYAGKVFQGTHRFICRDSNNPRKYDYKFLFNSYKKIIDASANYPHIAVDNLPVFDQIFAIFFTDNTYFALDNTKEGIRCSHKTADYLIDGNIALFKKTDWPEDAHFKKSTMHEFMMKILKMVETNGVFKGRETKYFTYVNEMLNLFVDQFEAYNEVVIEELISVSMDLITVRNPSNKTSFKKLSSACKKIQMKTLLHFLTKLCKIASAEQLKLIQSELTHMINSDSFFKGHSSALKKIKRLCSSK